MGIIQATSISHALALAEAGRSSGKWNLFRGQTNAAWKVTTSAERLSADDREQAYERYARFHNWARGEEAMNSYFDLPDSIWAIAQHYGIPTRFIDFTDDPKIAAFFASDTQRDAEPQQQAAIVCFNSEEFEEMLEIVWPIMTEGMNEAEPPEVIRIDVSNLWRLQAQRGCFLWNPVANIEMHFPFDRIEFPYTKDDPILPRRTEIYPLDQSELEKKLTLFFMNERMGIGNRGLEELVTKGIFRKVHWKVDSYDLSSWCSGPIIADDAWNNTQEWKLPISEHVDDALPGVLIELDPNADIETAKDQILRTFSPCFVESNRGKCLKFIAKGSNETINHHRTLTRRVRRLWNGMRTLPFTPDEIITSLKQCFVLLPKVTQRLHMREAFGQDGIYVEMASTMDGPGPYSRGAVTPHGLKAACTPAFLEAVRKKIGVDLEFKPEFIAKLPARPWERFTFAGLRKLMVEELIPTQIVWRADEEGDKALSTAIYFSPTEFNVFGLA